MPEIPRFNRKFNRIYRQFDLFVNEQRKHISKDCSLLTVVCDRKMAQFNPKEEYIDPEPIVQTLAENE